MAAVNKTHVIKLGGSLLDLSGLAARLGRFLKNCSAHQRLLIVGGGGVADLVRQFDTLHHLGKEHGHWLAVRAMHFNTHLVMSMVRGAVWLLMLTVAGQRGLHRKSPWLILLRGWPI